MFGRSKKNDNEKDPKIMKNVDKLIMGAIIGGAIGSVVGAKCGREKKNESASKKISFLRRLFGRKKTNGEKNEEEK